MKSPPAASRPAARRVVAEAMDRRRVRRPAAVRDAGVRPVGNARRRSWQACGCCHQKDAQPRDAGIAPSARAAVDAGQVAPRPRGKPKTRKEKRKAYIDTGLRHLKKRRFGKARKYFTKALKVWDGASLRRLFAIAHERAGEHWSAIHHMKRALKRRPRSAKYLTIIGRLYIRVRKRGTACGYFRKALRYKPGYSSAKKSLKRYCGGR